MIVRDAPLIGKNWTCGPCGMVCCSSFQRSCTCGSIWPSYVTDFCQLVVCSSLLGASTSAYVGYCWLQCRMSSTLNRFDDMIMNLSIDALINGRITYTPVGTAGNVPLPGHAVSQIRILYCFVQYIKYIYRISDCQFDL